ncbi:MULTISPECIES: ATP-binding protein [unclassified Streptomyces]|uniref:ATP-binding protein n=1 Tax=unclassified Streptomyces TaxID=2593676 RepID=UPI0037F68153
MAFAPAGRRQVPSGCTSTLFTHDLLLRSQRDDIKLCVSELATNALLHGVPPGREFAVRLRATEDLVRLEVRDSGGGRPAIQHAEDECCSGRGLFLVDELAAEFGVDHHVVGKTVRLAFKRPAAPFVP